jgi:hypothetical protein
MNVLTVVLLLAVLGPGGQQSSTAHCHGLQLSATLVSASRSGPILFRVEVRNEAGFPLVIQKTRLAQTYTTYGRPKKPMGSYQVCFLRNRSSEYRSNPYWSVLQPIMSGESDLAARQRELWPDC